MKYRYIGESGKYFKYNQVYWEGFRGVTDDGNMHQRKLVKELVEAYPSEWKLALVVSDVKSLRHIKREIL